MLHRECNTPPKSTVNSSVSLSLSHAPPANPLAFGLPLRLYAVSSSAAILFLSLRPHDTLRDHCSRSRLFVRNLDREHLHTHAIFSIPPTISTLTPHYHCNHITPSPHIYILYPSSLIPPAVIFHTS